MKASSTLNSIAETLRQAANLASNPALAERMQRALIAARDARP